MGDVETGNETYHTPHIVAHGLPNGACDEDDVRDADDGLAAYPVGENAGAEAAKEGAEGGRA